MFTNKAGERFTQYLYSVDVTGKNMESDVSGTLMIDDNYVIFDGKDYRLPNSLFVPKDVGAGVYQFQAFLSHPETEIFIQIPLPWNYL